MALNESNFITWYTAGRDEFDTVLPRPFVREPETLSPVVWMVPGEEYSIWINTITNTAMDGALQFVPPTGAAVPAQILLSQNVTFPAGAHRIITFVAPNLPVGIYRLKIGNNLSQRIWMSDVETATGCTAYIQFRNSDRVMSFRWAHAPAGFYQALRVRLSMRGAEPETNKKVYTGSYTGKTRPLAGTMRKLVTITTQEYDEAGHDAWHRLLEHDTITINQRPYAFNAPYKANMTEGDRISTGECQLSDEFYAGLNR